MDEITIDEAKETLYTALDDGDTFEDTISQGAFERNGGVADFADQVLVIESTLELSFDSVVSKKVYFGCPFCISSSRLLADPDRSDHAIALG